MKKLTLILVALLLLAVASTALASSWYCPQCSRLNDGNFCPVDGQGNPLNSKSETYSLNNGSSSSNTSYGGSTSYGSNVEVWGLTKDNLATRSGPATEYTEPGTFKVRGQYVKIVSISYDENSVPWVQCEVTYRGALMRVYTGLKRFDKTSFDLASVTNENTYWSYSTSLNSSFELQYGPGYDYATMTGYKLKSGKKVTVITTENDWAQIEFKTSNGSLCRGWIPYSYLN